MGDTHSLVKERKFDFGEFSKLSYGLVSIQGNKREQQDRFLAEELLLKESNKICNELKEIKLVDSNYFINECSPNKENKLNESDNSSLILEKLNSNNSLKYLTKPTESFKIEINNINEYIFNNQTSQINKNNNTIKTDITDPTNLNNEIFLFSLFDGNGGQEISEFCKQKFVPILKKCSFMYKNYPLALCEALLTLDKMLISDSGIEELSLISKDLEDKDKDSEKEKHDLNYEELEQVEIMRKVFNPRCSKNTLSLFMGVTCCTCLIIPNVINQAHTEENNLRTFENETFESHSMSFKAKEHFDNNIFEAIPRSLSYTVHIASIGNTKAFLYEKGQYRQITKDHNVDNLEEQNRIFRAGGNIVDKKIDGLIKYTRSIGDFEYKSNTNLNLESQIIISFPELYEIELSENISDRDSDTFILICTDSLFDHISVSKVFEFISQKINSECKGQELTNICLELCDQIEEKTTSNVDNTTLILIKPF